MNRLREFRDAAGLTQDRLAAKAHTTQNRIAELERDLQPWRSEVCALAMALGVKTETLFPDGFKVKKGYNNGSETHQPEKMYEPDLEPAPPARPYPRRSFSVMCWKCRTTMTMKADDYHPSAFDEPLRCPVCRAWFGDIVPLEEAAHV